MSYARHRTPQLKEVGIQAYIASGGHISKTCEAIQVSRHVWQGWMVRDAEFKQRVMEADEAIKDNMEMTLKTQALERGNWPQLKYFLETHCKDRGYLPDSQRVEHTGEIVLKVEKTIIGDVAADASH